MQAFFSNFANKLFRILARKYGKSCLIRQKDPSIEVFKEFFGTVRKRLVPDC